MSKNRGKNSEAKREEKKTAHGEKELLLFIQSALSGSIWWALRGAVDTRPTAFSQLKLKCANTPNFCFPSVTWQQWYAWKKTATSKDNETEGNGWSPSTAGLPTAAWRPCRTASDPHTNAEKREGKGSDWEVRVSISSRQICFGNSFRGNGKRLAVLSRREPGIGPPRRRKAQKTKDGDGGWG